MLGPNDEEQKMHDEVAADTNEQNPVRGKCPLNYSSPSLNLVRTW